MKILHVIPSVSPVRGGPSQAVLEMVRALRNAGVEAEIATTNDHGTDLLDVPLHRLTEYHQVPVRFFPRFSPAIHAVREFAFSQALTSWLWRHGRDYDLLHIHAIFSYPSTAAMAIARRQQIPYITRPLGQLCEWSLQQGARKKQLYLDWIERTNLNHSQALHFTSAQEQQETNRLGLTAPGIVLPHGLMIPPPLPDARQRLRQQLNLPADEPIILFLSRLHPKKGLDYLIPALGHLTQHRFTFVLAGGGTPEYEAELGDLLVANGMGDRTYRSGFVTGDLKELLMQGADLFALTSHSENFGVAVLEAMAAGLPVVTTPGVALSSFVAAHQLGSVADLEVAKIAAAFEYWLNHPDQMRQVGDRARQFVLAHYTWNQIAVYLKQIYIDILESQRL